MNQKTLAAIKEIKPFMSSSQINCLVDGFRSEEKEFFKEKAREIAGIINNMPVTYEQDGDANDAIVYLHYFTGGCDWWITEKDIEGGIDQAFGFACINDPQNAELGYISIRELTKNNVELDFYYKQQTIGEVKESLY